MRAVPGNFDPVSLAEIDRRLDAIKRDYDVHIPLAIESGSRAWGFASPDSDYDCRFVFVRKRAAHLTPFTARDVIETPLIDLIDLNGWDFAKAIKLLLKGNAVIVEWLHSPIVYAGDDWFRAAFLEFAERHADRTRLARHYLHMGTSKFAEHYGASDTAPLKKLFYVARPALALRWLRLHPDVCCPPMNFAVLSEGADLPVPVAQAFEDLIAKKAVTRELGEGPIPPEVRAFIKAELESAEAAFPAAPASDGGREAATAFYRDVVERLG